MDKFTILTNKVKDPEHGLTNKIKKYLKNHQKECLVLETGKPSSDQTYYHTNPAGIPDDTECIIVLGGDGTLLQAARDVLEKDIPLFGINMGTLGYLAEIDRHSVYPALDMLMSDRYTIERRMMIEGIITRDGKKIAENIALNDIVISREGELRVVRFNNYVNDTYLNTYKADGIIVSTPTGSTGYSLSAGGPIISPNASMLLMTPLAPHTLNSRSIIFSPEDEITVELGEGRYGTEERGIVSYDGASQISIVTGDRVRIRRFHKDTRIIKINNISFLETLRKKMSNN